MPTSRSIPRAAATTTWPDPLISGEQFGLGGLGSVRGTSIDRPVTGDYGVSGSVEVTTPEVAAGLRLLGFIDAGWVGNNSGAGLGGKLPSDHLASAGFGVRYAHDPFALTADYGRLLNSSRLPLATNSAAPQRGDDRFYVNLSLRF